MKYLAADLVKYLRIADRMSLKRDSSLIACGELSGKFYHIERSISDNVLFLMNSLHTATISWQVRSMEIHVTGFGFNKLNTPKAISLLVEQLVIVSVNGNKRVIKVKALNAPSNSDFLSVLLQYDFSYSVKGRYFEAELLLGVRDRNQIYY